MLKRLFFIRGNHVVDGEINIDEELLTTIINSYKPNNKREEELLFNARILLEDTDKITTSKVIKYIIDFNPRNRNELKIKKDISNSIIHFYTIVVIDSKKIRSNNTISDKVRQFIKNSNGDDDSVEFNTELESLINNNSLVKDKKLFRKRIIKSLPKTKRYVI